MLESSHKSSPTRTGEWMSKAEVPEKEWPPYVENPRAASLFKQIPGYLLHPLDPGFNIDNFDETNIWPLLDAPAYEHAYKLYFVGKEHDIYVNTIDDPALGPVVVCCEKFNPQVIKISLKVLIQTKKGAERLQLPTTTVTELGPYKALLSIKPEFTKLKLKPVGRGIERALQIYEEQIVRNVYKFGVLYCKEGQNSEDEMYNNEHGSEVFEEFLNFLGERITLQGFTGYRGGLDVKENTTGTHSVYTKHLDGCEIMFHVSTLLKYYPLDPQQVERKRHLGNDVILIIFREGKNQPFDMSTFHSQFNHVFFVVTPIRSREGTKYRVEIGAKEGVVPFSPPLPLNSIGRDAVSRNWLLTKLINAERAAFYAPSFVTKFRDTRKQQLTNIINEAKTDAPKKYPGSGIRRGLQTMRLKMSGSSVDLPDNFFSAPINFNHVAHMDNGTLTQFDSQSLMDIFAPDQPFFKFDNNPLKPPPGPPQEGGIRPPPTPPKDKVSFGKYDDEYDDVDFDEDEELEAMLSKRPKERQPKKGNTWGSQNKATIARPTISSDIFKPPTPTTAPPPVPMSSKPSSTGHTPKRPAPPRPLPPRDGPKSAPPPVPVTRKVSATAPGTPRKTTASADDSITTHHSPSPGGDETHQNGDSPSSGNTNGGGSNRPPASRRLSRGAGRGVSGTLRGTKKLPPPPKPTGE